MAAWFLPAAMAGVGALQGAMGAQAQRKAEKRNMMANAAAIEYSPWTGMKPDLIQGGAQNPLGSALGGAAQGALSGAMFGQQFAGGGGDEAEQAPWLYMNKSQAGGPGMMRMTR